MEYEKKKEMFDHQEVSNILALENEVIVPKSRDKNPFLISECEVVNGRCYALVIAVGKNTLWERTVKAVDPPPTPQTFMQDRLNLLAKRIGYVGLIFSVMIFIIQCVTFSSPAPGQSEARYYINAIITAFAIPVVAIPEGLPIAVVIALAFSAKKMLKTGNLIQTLSACETMARTTTIFDRHVVPYQEQEDASGGLVC